MKKLLYLILSVSCLFFLNSCGSRAKYKEYEAQAIKDESNETIRNSWSNKPQFVSSQVFTYDGKILNVSLYLNDPARDKLGFNPYRNNAAIYRDYYKKRSESWKTLWGLFN